MAIRIEPSWDFNSNDSDADGSVGDTIGSLTQVSSVIQTEAEIQAANREMSASMRSLSASIRRRRSVLTGPEVSFLSDLLMGGDEEKIEKAVTVLKDDIFDENEEYAENDNSSIPSVKDTTNGGHRSLYSPPVKEILTPPVTPKVSKKNNNVTWGFNDYGMSDVTTEKVKENSADTTNASTTATAALPDANSRRISFIQQRRESQLHSHMWKAHMAGLDLTSSSSIKIPAETDLNNASLGGSTHSRRLRSSVQRLTKINELKSAMIRNDKKDSDSDKSSNKRDIFRTSLKDSLTSSPKPSKDPSEIPDEAKTPKVSHKKNYQREKTEEEHSDLVDKFKTRCLIDDLLGEEDSTTCSDTSKRLSVPSLEKALPIRSDSSMSIEAEKKTLVPRFRPLINHVRSVGDSIEVTLSNIRESTSDESSVETSDKSIKRRKGSDTTDEKTQISLVSKDDAYSSALLDTVKIFSGRESTCDMNIELLRGSMTTLDANIQEVPFLSKSLMRESSNSFDASDLSKNETRNTTQEPDDLNISLRIPMRNSDTKKDNLGITQRSRRRLSLLLESDPVTSIYDNSTECSERRIIKHLKSYDSESKDDTYSILSSSVNGGYNYSAWEALHDEYALGYGFGNSLVFSILGTHGEDERCKPHVLSPALMESLSEFVPDNIAEQNFWIKFSLVRDGDSHYSLLQKTRGSKYTILAIETLNGEVFGSFQGTPWKKSSNWYGNGEAFLWRMRQPRTTKCFSVIDQAQLESEIDVYPWLGNNYMVQFCDSERIAVGGGDIDSNGEAESGVLSGFGLTVDRNLLSGTTSPCATFGNPSLCAENDGGVFDVANLEIWTFTPCSSEKSAEKLELGKLFLASNSMS